MSDPVRIMAGRLRRRCAPLAATSLGESRSEPWQSLLFDGGRHRFALCLDGPALDAAVDAIRDEIGGEFKIPGHIIAEIRVTGVDRHERRAKISLEALTITDSGMR